MDVKLLTEHHLEFLSLKGDRTGSSESTFVKMPHCWKSHVTAHIFIVGIPVIIIEPTICLELSQTQLLMTAELVELVFLVFQTLYKVSLQFFASNCCSMNKNEKKKKSY